MEGSFTAHGMLPTAIPAVRARFDSILFDSHRRSFSFSFSLHVI
jgi:hypothetical protein|tara:strand:- start:68 stop:199 length:132 start_codon:yes stop_codon:yes gene_type:complete